MPENKVVKLTHKELKVLDSSQDLRKLDPNNISFEKIRMTADIIKDYLETPEDKDPYSVAVKARAANNSISECLRVITAVYGFCKSEAAKEYSIAKLERAERWFIESKKDGKLTDGLRTAYCDLDERYLEAKNKEIMAKSLLVYLQNKYRDFENDLFLAKKKMGVDESEEKVAGLSNIEDEEEYEG